MMTQRANEQACKTIVSDGEQRSSLLPDAPVELVWKYGQNPNNQTLVRVLALNE